MEQLTDFLNHGLLPFTGRAADVERLVRFWRGSFDAQELRTVLLLGEAGMGKSRLLEEALPRIVDAGGCVIHAKLVPESTTSLVPLITRGLLYSETTRRFFKDRPGTALADAIEMLRRLSRLFPTLLVLEDIHLIAGDTLRELAMLLEAVSDEKLSLLCLSRPVDLPARAVIERSIVEEIELEGFDAGQIAGVWIQLFGTEPEPEIAGLLREITGGNPLALRSTLRGAVTSRAIVRNALTGGWYPTLDTETFCRALRRNVDLLVEGMAAHLTEQERMAATLLASLGEVFAGETAQVVVENAREMIRSLTFKGILAPASTVSPLLGAAVALPSTFTHTLLHQHLVERSSPPLPELIDAIAAGRPLYSALPFRLVAGRPVPASVPVQTLRRAVDATIDVAFRLDNGPDWPLAPGILNAGRHLFEALEGRLDAAGLLLLEASLLSCRLSLLRRSAGSEEFARHLARLLEITACTEKNISYDDRMLPLRLRALRHLHGATCITDYPACAEIWEQVEELIEESPALMESEAYLRFLEEVARAAHRFADETMLRRVDTRLARLLALPDLSPALRSYAHERVAANLLQLFDSARELERRLELALAASSRIDGRNESLAINRTALLLTIGRMPEALEAATRAAGHFRGAGLALTAAHAELIALSARAALETDLETIEREAQRLASGSAPSAAASFRRNIGIYLGQIGLLRGELAWTARIDEAYGGSALSFWPEGILLMTSGPEELRRAVEELPLHARKTHALCDLGVSLLAGDAGAHALELATSLLAQPLLRLDDLLRLRATMAMLDGPIGGRLGAKVVEEIRRAATGALEWLQERRLHAMMTALLDRHRDLLAKKEMTAWRSRIRALAEERRSAESPAGSKMRVSMIGTITVVGRDGEARQLRGARAKTMLGLLVAAEMVRVPLTRREFTTIASGGETDPDLAKKTTVMAAARLRETIGAEAVATGEPMYLLDLAQVSIDLLEAHASIEEARKALRRGALLQASTAMLGALRATRSEIPFPGLYDNFFETVRDDFESRLRTTAVDAARLLLRDAHAEAAEELLRAAFDRMRDDEEVAELLEEALNATGHRTDSVRVGRLVQESVG